MFNPEWLCNNQAWLSVVMVVFSVIGALVGAALIVFSLIKLLDAGDVVVGKVNNKFNLIPREKRSTIKDKSKLLGIGILEFILICFFGLISYETLIDIFAGLAVILIMLVILTTIIWLNEKADHSNFRAPKIIKEIGFYLFMFTAGFFLLFCVGKILYELYKWWILKICGA